METRENSRYTGASRVTDPNEFSATDQPWSEESLNATTAAVSGCKWLSARVGPCRNSVRIIHTYALWMLQKGLVVESGGMAVIRRVHGPCLFYDELVVAGLSLEMEQMLDDGLPGLLVLHSR